MYRAGYYPIPHPRMIYLHYLIQNYWSGVLVNYLDKLNKPFFIFFFPAFRPETLTEKRGLK